ncbi:hypothetical protein [Cohnella silvisoli]|uniref:Endolytic transglycosylase MltG n=1 Tax=Cohnella silvisoli TaxID=2873699 RepID=A0ABV1KV71_9BACL|nr:hypothetical protein [Cohnella silvisoli]MCD9023391.1 hypothetical protein [Cohnella silvisoli]
MHKYRSWLMGLGIGIILGSSMLQIIQLAKNQAVMVADEPMTREQLDTEAKKAGFVLSPAGQTLYTQDQLNAKIDEAVAAASKDGINDTKGALKPPAPSETANSENAGAGDSEDPKAVTLYIRKNMTLTEAAERLQKLGVIDDVEDFVRRAKSISKKMNVGTAVFTGKPNYKQIMAELTREK